MTTLRVPGSDSAAILSARSFSARTFLLDELRAIQFESGIPFREFVTLSLFADSTRPPRLGVPGSPDEATHAGPCYFSARNCRLTSQYVAQDRISRLARVSRRRNFRRDPA